MMAIVVAGLGSAPIRRLHQSWAGVQKEHRDLFKEIDTILDSKVTKLMKGSEYINPICTLGTFFRCIAKTMQIFYT